jgi:phosphatidate cytidylyltransferase
VIDVGETGKRQLYASLTLRVLATVVFVPALIIITRRGGLHFLGLIGMVIFLGMWEFYRLIESKGIRPRRWLGLGCGLGVAWYLYTGEPIGAGLFMTLALLAVMGTELSRRDGGSAVANISTTIFGVVYVAFLSVHLVLLRELPRLVGADYAMGGSFVFLAFVTAWSCDTGAYFVGSWRGRHPLLPRISQKKTREGAAGGILFAVIGVLIARATFAGYLEVWHAVLIAVLGGAAGIVGDLVESMLKRDAAVKDASQTIPGHGGVLDRFDSLLFTAPLIYYFLKFIIFK